MRRIARGVPAVGAAFLLATTACDPTPAESPPRSTGAPNVLIVVTDDQRAHGTLGVMPATRRWFAGDGTRFSNAFATTPYCCPSRASIFTGRYAHNHDVHTNRRVDGERLDPDTTVQRFLRDAGYRTAIFGKYLNNWNLERNPPHFDTWSIFNNGYVDETWNVDGEVGMVPEYATTFVADRATGFLRETEADDARPWFLYLAPGAPHWPYTPEPRFAGAPVPAFRPAEAAGESDVSDKPPFVRRGARPIDRIVDARQQQLRTLLSVDRLVDRVFRTLRATGEADDTLAFFLSDNGFLWGEHGLKGKTVPYLDSIRVPFLVRWPGRVGAGMVDRRIVANIDIAPTVLQAAGIRAGLELDGRSLMSGGRRHTLLAEYWKAPDAETPTWASIVTADLQYIEYYGPGGSRVTFREYYDLRADPAELENLVVTDHRDVADLSAELERLRGCSGDRCAGRDAPLR